MRKTYKMIAIQHRGQVDFPDYTGIRCLMMPYVQGPGSVPKEYRHGYEDILADVFFQRGDIGFLTIDESLAKAGKPHRGKRATTDRALHTEAGKRPGPIYGWGPGTGWGRSHKVTLDLDVRVLLANNLDDSCALWDATHEDTSLDGDIGHVAEQYPHEDSILIKAGEVYEIGILTPHESLPVKNDYRRQFLRIVSKGVHGREPYFTVNPLMET